MWYYVNNGQQQGPFDEAQFEGLIAGGTIGPATYVWREGQPNWLPLGDVRGAAVGGATCQVCQQPVGTDNLIELNGVRVCAACKPVALQTMREGLSLGGASVWVQGKKVVTRDGAVFPARCFKCNTSTTDAAIQRKLYWNSPWLLFLIFTPYLGIIAYIIVAIILRKRATIDLHVCPKHQQQRTYGIIGSWLCVVGAIAAIASAIAFSKGWLGLVGAILIVGAVVVAINWARYVLVTRIDKNKTVWLRGAGAEFRASLPPWPGS